MKIIYKTFLILLVVLIFSLVANVLSSYYSTENLIGSNTKEMELHMTHSMLQDVDGLLHKMYLEIQLIATSNPFRKYLSRGLVAKAEVVLRAKEFETYTGPWELISIIDKNANIVYSTIADEIGKSIKLTPSYELWKKSMAGEINYSDVFITIGTDHPSLIFSAPVRDINILGNPVVGVVQGFILWPAVLEHLESFGVDMSKFSLYNKNGDYLGGSDLKDRAQILKRNDKDKEFFKSNLAELEKKEAFSLAQPDDFGVSSIMAFVKESGYLDYRGNGWILVSSLPASVAYSGLWGSMVGPSIFFFISILLASAIFIFLLLKYIVSPVNLLTKISKEIVGGNLSERVIIPKSDDEIHDLAESFNQMTDNLVNINLSLEETVKNRTAELNNKVDELEEGRRAELNLLEDLGKEKLSLEEAMAKSDAILVGIGDGIVALDKKGKIIVINPRAGEMLGYKTSELMGEDFFEIFEITKGRGNVEIEKDAHPVWLSLKTKKAFLAGVKDDYYYTRKDGSRFPVSLSVSPIFLNGEVIGEVNVFRDITEDKQLDTAKSEFISLASHQLRTPLSSSKWVLELFMGDKGLRPKHKERINDLYISNERLISLVNDLLSVARIETGRLAPGKGLVKIAELIEASCKALKSIALVNKQKIKLSIAEDVDGANISSMLFTEAFENILSNAMNYASPKSDIDVVAKLKDGNYEISVHNVGSFIDERDRVKLFSKFYRGEGSSDVKTAGSGLGLYIAKSSVDANGGKIWFESNLEDGTTFYFTIPIK